MKVHLVSIEKWDKLHIVKENNKGVYTFYCGRKQRSELCTKNEFLLFIHDEDKLVCSVCTIILKLGKSCNRNTNNINIGDNFKCPMSVSETGWLKIVGDQTHCTPNTQQPGVTNWKYLVIEYDQDNPDEVRQAFQVTEKELKEWESYL